MSRSETLVGCGAAALALTGCLSDDGQVPTSEATAALGGANFQWVNTINGGTGSPTNLRAIIGSDSTTTSIPVIVVGGHSTVGDGGGGTFFWDASAATGDNDGTIIVPSGGTGRWVRLYAGPINVRWFGATGGGSVDDAAKINAAIAFAGGAGGGTVLVPKGRYRLDTPLQLTFVGVRLVGEGAGATFLELNATSSKTIVFNASSFNCEVSNLSLRPSTLTAAPTTGAAITFSQPINQANIRIREVMISPSLSGTVHFQGIAVAGAGFGAGGNAVWVATVEKVRIWAQGTGIYLPFAINWTLTDVIVQMPANAAPGSNIFGVWLDTGSEGCELNDIYVLGGEHCWRMSNTAGSCGGVRGPCEHRFNFCVADNGTVSCFYISSLHRAIFSYCWCSTQSVNSDAALVMDTTDIWGVDWSSSQMVNIQGHAIKILAAVSFSVTNSTFSEWNLVNLAGRAAIFVTAGAGVGRTNFQIIGNRFIRDADFGTHTNATTVSVQAGTYNKYVIANNLSYSGTSCANLGSGSLTAVSDLGTASGGKSSPTTCSVGYLLGARCDSVPGTEDRKSDLLQHRLDLGEKSPSQSRPRRARNRARASAHGTGRTAPVSTSRIRSSSSARHAASHVAGGSPSTLASNSAARSSRCSEVSASACSSTIFAGVAMG